jgi:hypothetical protein
MLLADYYSEHAHALFRKSLKGLYMIAHGKTLGTGQTKKIKP